MLKKLWTLILNTILPPRCSLCGQLTQSSQSLCADCFAELDFITPPLCQTCGLPLPPLVHGDLKCVRCLSQKSYFDTARACVLYNDISKKLIQNFKYYDHTELADILASLMARISDIDYKMFDLIIPIPIHTEKLKSRKYNQAALLAQKMGNILNLPVQLNLLVKITSTPAQAGLSFVQRQKNIKNSFNLNPKAATKLKGKNILLIDDVITTTATINEASRILKKHKARQVVAITFAHTHLQ